MYDITGTGNGLQQNGRPQYDAQLRQSPSYNQYGSASQRGNQAQYEAHEAAGYVSDSATHDSRAYSNTSPTPSTKRSMPRADQEGNALLQSIRAEIAAMKRNLRVPGTNHPAALTRSTINGHSQMGGYTPSSRAQHLGRRSSTGSVLPSIAQKTKKMDNNWNSFLREPPQPKRAVYISRPRKEEAERVKRWELEQQAIAQRRRQEEMQRREAQTAQRKKQRELETLRRRQMIEEQAQRRVEDAKQREAAQAEINKFYADYRKTRKNSPPLFKKLEDDFRQQQEAEDLKKRRKYDEELGKVKLMTVSVMTGKLQVRTILGDQARVPVPSRFTNTAPADPAAYLATDPHDPDRPHYGYPYNMSVGRNQWNGLLRGIPRPSQPPQNQRAWGAGLGPDHTSKRYQNWLATVAGPAHTAPASRSTSVRRLKPSLPPQCLEVQSAGQVGLLNQ
ncbi:hypothetical protein WJX72_012070 [[Myrmecia] bisecta]|uniref:Uncharacterized protein n=1 Tax=[Myrmecia] bisecta TaxID=41462 RepID=A0AAW1QT60_9CHLO